LSARIKIEHECSVVAQLITTTMIYATPMVRNGAQSGNQMRMQKGLVDPEPVVAVR
jgi:hypothetical protein